ncbi:unnamed protein product [Blepharisma stoltei]|uniref:Calcium-dependent protein kinase n=1 Tax=Blepharisma stoltei TaxID=1481888 RepID=A0AAU9ILM1_9CILI|nr:unnamed protein product [Blepharisma stoltei]
MFKTNPDVTKIIMGCCESKPEKPSLGSSKDQSRAERLSLINDSNEPSAVTTPVMRAKPRRYTTLARSSAKKKSVGIDPKKSFKRRSSSRISKGLTSEKYKTIKILQTGPSGNLYLVKDKYNGTQRVAKEIPKEIFGENPIEFFKEMEKFNKLNYPHIIRFFELAETDEAFYVIYEKLFGSSLLEKILEHGAFNDYAASTLISNILKALNHCHKLGIIHRNIRPESIVFDSNARDSTLKLTNFEFIWTLSEMQQTKDTVTYMAPEMIQGNYNKKTSDIWSLGIILHVLMTGKLPFTGKNNDEVIKSIQNGIDLKSKTWALHSDEVKDLLSKMLKIDPDDRISAADALKHPWIVNKSRKLDQIKGSTDILNRFLHFDASKKIEKSIYFAITSHIYNDNDQKEIIEVYKALDKNHDGKLSKKEIIDGCKALRIEVSGMDEIIMKCDIDKSGFFEFYDFEIAAAQWNYEDVKEKLKKSLKPLDFTCRGAISLEELKKILRGIDMEELEQFFKYARIDEEGYISYEEINSYLLMKFD